MNSAHIFQSSVICLLFLVHDNYLLRGFCHPTQERAINGASERHDLQRVSQGRFVGDPHRDDLWTATSPEAQQDNSVDTAAVDGGVGGRDGEGNVKDNGGTVNESSARLSNIGRRQLLASALEEEEALWEAKGGQREEGKEEEGGEDDRDGDYVIAEKEESGNAKEREDESLGSMWLGVGTRYEENEEELEGSNESLGMEDDQMNENEGDNQDDIEQKGVDSENVIKVEYAKDLGQMETEEDYVPFAGDMQSDGADENDQYIGSAARVGLNVMPRSISPDRGSGKPTLASFEGTPLPPEVSIQEWQTNHRYRISHAHSDGVDGIETRTASSLPTKIDLSSSTFLAGIDTDFYRTQKGYVAICAVVRDAHDDVLEWLHHHRRLGMHPIYIYDHSSTPPMSGVLGREIENGHVVYRYFVDFEHSSGRPQLWAYDDCLQQHGFKHTWIAFIDVDEFLVFKTGATVQSLPLLLKRYEDFSALAVHWILFGSSGHISRPSKGVLRSYVRCMPRLHTQHLFIKTIAQPRCTVGTSDSPHSFIHNCSYPAVRTDGSPVLGPKTDDEPIYDVLAIHHYALKSQEEFEIKMLRGSGMKRQR